VFEALNSIRVLSSGGARASHLERGRRSDLRSLCQRQRNRNIARLCARAWQPRGRRVL